MNNYAGICMGGPMSGQALTHFSKRKEYFKKMPEGSGLAWVKAGEYKYDEKEGWKWHPTTKD